MVQFNNYTLQDFGAFLVVFRLTSLFKVFPPQHRVHNSNYTLFYWYWDFCCWQCSCKTLGIFEDNLARLSFAVWPLVGGKVFPSVLVLWILCVDLASTGSSGPPTCFRWTMIYEITPTLTGRKMSEAHMILVNEMYPTCCRGGYQASIWGWTGSAGSEHRGSSLDSMTDKCLSSTVAHRSTTVRRTWMDVH